MAYDFVDLLKIIDLKDLAKRQERNNQEISRVLEQLLTYENVTGVPTNTTVTENKAIWDRANNITAEGKFLTSKLQGAIEALTNQINAGSGTVTITEDDGILIVDNAETPTKALRLLGGIFAIADSKDEGGNWEWRTFGTGDGFTADLLTSGKILTTLINIVGDKYYTKILGDGLRVYNKDGYLAGHFGHYETLAAQLSTFTRASTAYKQDGSSVASGMPRYEYARIPAPIWQDLFDTDDLDEYTSGGDTAATWAIADGVLTGTGGTQATLLKNNLLLGNVEIEVNCDWAHDAGIIARYQDNGNYYLLAIRDDDSTNPLNLQIYKRINGAYKSLGGTDLPWERGTLKTIRFTLHGSRLEVWFEGAKVISVIDTAYTGGLVGFRCHGTVSGPIVNFHNFKVYHVSQGVMVEEGTSPLVLNPFFSNYTGTLDDDTGDTFASWSQGNTGTGRVEAVTGEFGGVAMKAVQTDATASAQWRGVYQTRTLADMGLAVGDVISVQIRYKMSAFVGAAALFYIVFRDASEAAISSHYIIPYNSTEEQPVYTVKKLENITIPEGTVYIRFYAMVRSSEAYSGANNQLWVDYFTCEKKAYCTTPTNATRAVENLTTPTAGVFTKSNWSVEFDYTPLFNPPTADGVSKYLWLVYIAGSDYWGIRVYNGQILFRLISGGVTYGITYTGPVTYGTTYRIMFTGDGTKIRACVNGVQIGSDLAYIEPVGSIPASMYIGYYGSTAANGVISNFRLSSARTLAQHQADYNSGLPLSVDEYTTLLMTMDGTLQPTVRRFGLKVINGELTLMDPPVEGGIRVYDASGNLKAHIGQFASGNYGVKIIKGEIYSTTIRTGTPTQTTKFVEMTDVSGTGVINFYGQGGELCLSMNAGGSQGKTVYYMDGAEKATIEINGSITRDFWIHTDAANGINIAADTGETIKLGPCSGVSTDRGVYISRIRGSLLPYTDGQGNVGETGHKWSLVRAYTITSGDLAFEEKYCPLCEQYFKPGDVLTLYVTHIHEDYGTLSIPIHEACKGIKKRLTFHVPEIETQYRLNEQGEVQEIKVAKTEEFQKEVKEIKKGFEFDSKTGLFSKLPVFKEILKPGFEELTLVDEEGNTKKVVVDTTTRRPVSRNLAVEKSQVEEARAATKEESLITSFITMRRVVMKTITVDTMTEVLPDTIVK